MDERVAARLHVVEGLLLGLERLPEINEVVRGCQDRFEATAVLMSQFGLTEIQVQHLLDMTVARQTRLGRAALQNEADQLRSM